MQRFMLCVALSCALLAGCGGQDIQSPAPQSPLPVELAGGMRLPALPPAGHFLPQKLAAAAEVGQTGSRAVKQAHGVVDGTALMLTAPAGELAYAQYRFDGVPGETLGELTFSGSGLSEGGEIWIAVADYAAMRWRFLPAQTGASGSVNLAELPGSFVSPGGDFYVIVAVFDNVSYSIDALSLGYAERHTVSGQVLDAQGQPVAGATVSMPLFSTTVLTDAGGNFTLPGAPDGNWPVMAAKNGWTFFDNPAFATVTGGPVEGISFMGTYTDSNFLPADPGGWNNNIGTASPQTFAGPLSDSLSIIDDAVDFFSFTAGVAGDYHLEFTNPNGDIYFPALEVFDSAGMSIETSYFCLRGMTRVAFTTADPDARLVCKVSLGGGGGEYGLALASGETQRHLRGQLVVSDRDFLESALVLAAPADGPVTEYISVTGGWFEDAFRPALPTTVTPQATGYNFNPASLEAALADADQTGLAFTVSGGGAGDSFEPNQNSTEAAANAVLALPYNSVAAGDELAVSGGNDMADYFQITPQIGNGVVVRLRYDGNAAESNQLYMNINDGGSGVRGTSVRTAQGLEVRLEQVASGASYYLLIGLHSGQFGAHEYPYEITVEEYTPAIVYFEVVRDGRPVPGVRIDMWDETFDWRRTFNTLSSGITRGLPLQGGQILHLELFRYGLGLDRSTLTYTIPEFGGPVVFDLDMFESLDMNEPDSDRPTSPLRTLPIFSTGTLEPVVDPADFYRFSVAPSTPLSVTLEFADPATEMDVRLLNAAGNQFAAGRATHGVPLVFDSGAGPGNRFIELTEQGRRTEYSLRIATDS